MKLNCLILFLFVVSLEQVIAGYRDRVSTARYSHRAKDFNDESFTKLVEADDMLDFHRVLDTILIPRVVGSPGHDVVKKFIKDELESLGWSIELDTFIDKTPIFGDLKFTNIIGRLNPNADRYLLLACHYDSKYFREAVFVGATDSAVPCAMILNLIRILKPYLDKAKSRTDLSLAVVFFDGEEAFGHWSATDSLYGARHLAKKWGSRAYPVGNREGTTYLDRIDLFVLLDLIGTPDPKYYSYSSASERWYSRFINIEERLVRNRKLSRYSYGYPEQRYFQQRSIRAYIEDDHTPFQKKNVPILHIIPREFPDVWHQPTDNRNALDFDTIQNQNKMLRAFVAEYLNLEV